LFKHCFLIIPCGGFVFIGSGLLVIAWHLFLGQSIFGSCVGCPHVQ